MENKFNIGDTVVKKSERPFKNGEKKQVITGFGVNEIDPKQRPCAVFSDGSVCNLDMLNKLIVFDIETGGLFADFGARGKGTSHGIPTGFLNAFSGSNKSGLVKFLPLEDKSEGSHMVVLENIDNIDNLKIIDTFNLMDFMKNKLENEPPKCIKTEHLVVGDVAFPITYFEDGMIIVDYPEKPF
jgi:hypothetical protein